MLCITVNIKYIFVHFSHYTDFILNLVGQLQASVVNLYFNSSIFHFGMFFKLSFYNYFIVRCVPLATGRNGRHDCVSHSKQLLFTAKSMGRSRFNEAASIKNSEQPMPDFWCLRWIYRDVRWWRARVVQCERFFQDLFWRTITLSSFRFCGH